MNTGTSPHRSDDHPSGDMSLAEQHGQQLGTLRERMDVLEGRVETLDGHRYDRGGGRVGRVESLLSKVLWLVVVTLISMLGTLAATVLNLKGGR